MARLKELNKKLAERNAKLEFFFREAIKVCENGNAAMRRIQAQLNSPDVLIAELWKHVAKALKQYLPWSDGVDAAAA